MALDRIAPRGCSCLEKIREDTCMMIGILCVDSLPVHHRNRTFLFDKAHDLFTVDTNPFPYRFCDIWLCVMNPMVVIKRILNL